MKLKEIISIALYMVCMFSFTNASATSETTDCVDIKALNSVIVDLDSSNDFMNCFSTDEIPQGNEILFNVVSIDQAIPFKVLIYDMSGNAAVEIKQLNSPTGETVRYESTVEAARIGFRVVPGGSVTEDVRMTLGFGITENAGGIFFINLDYVLGDTD
ncbi:hypothetical protein FM042_08220 [Aliidiomarina halalkaliphila]|uniref:Uncharacterized protein n=1 Tax=Aliidiomarina halalkaliphila TaxID=2593535 RepID=A0A552X1Y2_9GAMM|nr:hypothetical protein [Aliidiomarina halalkaliphila]TRW48956.1 hypothetical protein FM042_08220 [Aliidiomarina halalkaliphila]